MKAPAAFETSDSAGAHPRLNADQLDVFARVGRTRAVARGDILAKAGERTETFLIVTSGRVLVADEEPGQKASGRRESSGAGPATDTGFDAPGVEIHGPGRFIGDIGLLEGQPSFFTIVALEPGEVLEVPRSDVLRVVLGDPQIGDLILRACLIQRSIAIGTGSGLRIVGSHYSPQTRTLLDFVARNRLPHRLLDLDEDARAEAIVQGLGVEVDELPLVILGGDRLLRNPSPSRLAAELGLRPPIAPPECEMLIVGAGPGGLSAAVYGASDGLSVVVSDAIAAGGQAATSSRIENYLGFPAGVSGSELAERAVIQARKFGALLYPATEAQRIRHRGDSISISFADGSTVSAQTVVVASGASYNRLTATDLDRLEPTSVFYAATAYEARLCGDNPVAVVGGGNSAGQATLFLAASTPHVHLIVRRARLDETMSRYLVSQIVAHPQVTVHYETELVQAHGDTNLESVVVENRSTGAQAELPVCFVFVFIGATPASGWLGENVAKDEHGYLLTGGDARTRTCDDLRGEDSRGRLPLETSMPGVFAVGDVRSGSVKRVSAAIGEGASVVRQVHDYLEFGGSRF